TTHVRLYDSISNIQLRILLFQYLSMPRTTRYNSSYSATKKYIRSYANRWRKIKLLSDSRYSTKRYCHYYFPTHFIDEGSGRRSQATEIHATYINSSLTNKEQQERMRDVVAGHYTFVYVAPERFNSPAFLNQMKQIPLA